MARDQLGVSPQARTGSTRVSDAPYGHTRPPIAVASQGSPRSLDGPVRGTARTSDFVRSSNQDGPGTTPWVAENCAKMSPSCVPPMPPANDFMLHLARKSSARPSRCERQGRLSRAHHLPLVAGTLRTIGDELMAHLLLQLRPDAALQTDKRSSRAESCTASRHAARSALGRAPRRRRPVGWRLSAYQTDAHPVRVRRLTLGGRADGRTRSPHP